MTKTKTKKSTTKTQHRLPLYRRAWFLALIVILIIAAVVCAIVFLVKPGQNLASDSARSDDGSTTSSTGYTPADGQHENEDEPYSDPDQITVQYEGENPNRASDLSGNITYTGYSNGVISIVTVINQYLDNGTCELKLTGSNGNIYTATSDIFAAVATSACSDFNIDVTPDSYQIEILLTSGEKQGTITGEVSL